jgi:hypothetical protein
MKEFKLVRPGWAGGKAPQSEIAQQAAPRAEATMQMDAPVRKTGGRLSREDQRRLGDILQRVYDDVIRQGVPDRFRDLLSQLDGAKNEAEGPTGSSHGHGQSPNEDDSDRVVGARGLESPGSKGSH